MKNNKKKSEENENNEKRYHLIDPEFPTISEKVLPPSPLPAESYYDPRKEAEEKETLKREIIEAVKKEGQKPTPVENVSSYELPPGTKWENITIGFITGHDVYVESKGSKRIHTDYIEMGFQDEKRHLPDAQWALLQSFASNNGEFSWENALKIGIRNPATLRQRKKQLSDTLKKCFPQVKGEPFEEPKRGFLDVSKEKKMYRIKINLIPEPEQDTTEENPEISSWLKSQTPNLPEDLNNPSP